MAIVHKCDACRKVIRGRDSVTVDIPDHRRLLEFCAACAAPIVAVLKKYKLIAIAV
jgi:hypothetical protein